MPSDMVGKNAGAAQSELAQVGLGARFASADSGCSADNATTQCQVADVPQAGQSIAPGTDVEVDLTSPTLATSDAAPADDTVTYTVTGRRAGTITYQNGTGDTSQVTNSTKLPWTVSFTEPAGTEEFLYVSAQNAGSGTIGCSISINGQVVKQNTSTGTYAIVDCTD